MEPRQSRKRWSAEDAALLVLVVLSVPPEGTCVVVDVVLIVLSGTAETADAVLFVVAAGGTTVTTKFVSATEQAMLSAPFAASSVPRVPCAFRSDGVLDVPLLAGRASSRRVPTRARQQLGLIPAPVQGQQHTMTPGTPTKGTCPSSHLPLGAEHDGLMIPNISHSSQAGAPLASRHRYLRHIYYSVL